MSYEERDAKNDNNQKHPFPEKGIGCFAERLKTAMETSSLRGFSKKCGLSEATLRSYLMGSTYPTLDRLMQIADASSVDAQWLAFGVNGSPGGKMKSDEEEFVYVTQMAGSNGVINRLHAFRADWLKEQGLEPRHLTVMQTREDAMAPTIQPGDLLLCQTYMHRDGSNIAIGLAPGELPPQDGIYMIRRGDKGPSSLRRLRLDMAGGAIISADADSSVHLHASSDVLEGILIEARVVSFQRLV